MKWLINYSFGSHDMERGDLEDQHLPTWTVDQLEKDTGLTKDELKLIMEDRKMWRRLVMSVRDKPN